MWISRLHYELIAERAREFRAWHEQEIATRDAIIADRDRMIAKLEDSLAELAESRDELFAKLIEREEIRSRPPAALPEPSGGSWEAVMRQQIDELANGES